MSQVLNHQVLIVPGLGDDVGFVSWATQHWSTWGIQTTIFPMGWKDGQDFEPKLQQFLNRLRLKARKSPVSLVGISGGGSAVANAYVTEKKRVHRVINVCGRLRAGQHRLRSLPNMAWQSPAFKQSVLRFEQNEPKLTSDDRARFLTISAGWGDELVPRDTSILKGATNYIQPTPSHMLSIYLALRFPRVIMDFLAT